MANTWKTVSSPELLQGPNILQAKFKIQQVTSFQTKSGLKLGSFGCHFERFAKAPYSLIVCYGEGACVFYLL